MSGRADFNGKKSAEVDRDAGTDAGKVELPVASSRTQQAEAAERVCIVPPATAKPAFRLCFRLPRAVSGMRALLQPYQLLSCATKFWVEEIKYPSKGREALNVFSGCHEHARGNDRLYA
jgi:hypothetical protein